jgi:nicotinate-nucleotide adenylyltransferase
MADNEVVSQRIALYGGAFDPVHNAHLRIARYALKQVGLDRVIFIPAAQSPLKEHAPLASDEARMEMLELATERESRFKIDAYEIYKGGVSYTIDTVRYFRELYPRAELFWLIGADQFEQLDRWHLIDELVGLVTFLVFGRSGSTLKSCEIDGLNYFEVDAPLMEESSSEIRRRCGQGLPLEGFVPSAVEAFISEQGLYTDGH